MKKFILALLSSAIYLISSSMLVHGFFMMQADMMNMAECHDISSKQKDLSDCFTMCIENNNLLIINNLNEKTKNIAAIIYSPRLLFSYQEEANIFAIIKELWPPLQTAPYQNYIGITKKTL